MKPVGSKYWHAKDGEVFVKVAQPSRYAGRYSKSRLTERECWRPERIVNFEAVHGPVVRGLQVRRLLPLCNCPENLTLITPAVGAILNKGHWAKPNKPWSSLPPDAEIRLAAVIAAVAFCQAMGYRRNLTRPCECGCGEPVRSTATTTTEPGRSASDRGMRTANDAPETSATDPAPTTEEAEDDDRGRREHRSGQRRDAEQAIHPRGDSPGGRGQHPARQLCRPAASTANGGGRARTGDLQPHQGPVHRHAGAHQPPDARPDRAVATRLGRSRDDRHRVGDRATRSRACYGTTAARSSRPRAARSSSI